MGQGVFNFYLLSFAILCSSLNHYWSLAHAQPTKSNRTL